MTKQFWNTFAPQGLQKFCTPQGAKVLQDFFRQFHVKFSSAILLLPRECKSFAAPREQMYCKTIFSFNLTNFFLIQEPLQQYYCMIADWEAMFLQTLGMKKLPQVCKNYSLPLGDHAILYFNFCVLGSPYFKGIRDLVTLIFNEFLEYLLGTSYTFSLEYLVRPAYDFTMEYLSIPLHNFTLEYVMMSSYNFILNCTLQYLLVPSHNLTMNYLSRLNLYYKFTLEYFGLCYNFECTQSCRKYKDQSYE